MSTRRPNPGDPADDSVEIEVVPAVPPIPAPAAPAPAKRVRPRTPNPIADEVIHSGEIVEGRSRIIRSSESLQRIEAAKIEINDDPTEQTKIPTPPVIASAPRRLSLLWLVAAIVPSIVAGVLVFVEKSTPPPTASNQPTVGLQATAEMIGTTFDSDARAALVRVEAIASSSMLRAGIETDAQTLADMARDKDVVFPVEKAEVLEVFQVRDGVRTSMLRIPASAPTIVPPAVGTTRIEGRPEAITITAIAPVAKQNSKVTGEVVLSVPVDLDPIKKRITEHAIGASVIGFAAPVVLLTNATSGGANVSLPIETKLVKGPPLQLAAVIAPVSLAKTNALKVARFACMALAGLLLLVFLISLIRR